MKQIKIRIKTAEEFLKTEGLIVSSLQYFKIDGNYVHFTEKMWHTLGKEYIAEEFEDGWIEFIDENNMNWYVAPWMCSIWEEIESFEYYDLVEVRDCNWENWVMKHFIRMSDEKENKYGVTSLSREIYERLNDKEKEEKVSYWNQIRRI